METIEELQNKLAKAEIEAQAKQLADVNAAMTKYAAEEQRRRAETARVTAWRNLPVLERVLLRMKPDAVLTAGQLAHNLATETLGPYPPEYWNPLEVK